MGDYWLNPPKPGSGKANPPRRKNPNDKGCAVLALGMGAALVTGGAGVVWGVVEGVKAVLS